MSRIVLVFIRHVTQIFLSALNHSLIYLPHTLRVSRQGRKFMHYMNEPEGKEFFSKLWRCPIRRWRRYGRKLLIVFILGVLVWTSLDFMAILLMAPQTYPPPFLAYSRSLNHKH